MLATLREFTAIGAGSLWRNSGSRGEREAFEYLAARVAELETLAAMGATVERRSFRLPLAAELWQAGLEIQVAGETFAVPAGALAGNREDLARALRYDSDGVLNDGDRNPVVVESDVVVVRTATDLAAIPTGGLRGVVAFVNFALVDRAEMSSSEALVNAAAILEKEPAALVLVTRFSNSRGVSHGTFLGDVSAFAMVTAPASVPTVSVKLEDLVSAGIGGWNDIDVIERAKVIWDADIVSPASSQYLILHIPGRVTSHPVVLGAHADSPNTPGALDNGSGTVTVLEVARVLNAARVRPESDVVLAWFGSHERGLYGSSNFVLSHQELLDRTTAMLAVDCLTHPLDGLNAVLAILGQNFAAFGDGRLPFQSALQTAAAARGAVAYPWAAGGIISDNSTFGPFDVPNSDLIFESADMTESHIEGHLHDPYDDMPLAALHAGELEDMARIALSAVLDIGAAQPELRVTPPATRRAVFVASHTEPAYMTPAYQTMVGMALAWEAFDVDVIPYGQAVRGSDLEDADVVFALPVYDYPNERTRYESYDEQWDAAEIAALTSYVDGGGLLVVTNSANRLVSGTTPYEANEDWPDMNALATGFGVTFLERRVAGTSATTVGSHALVRGVGSLRIADGNGLAFQAPGAQTLATVGTDPVLALIGHGGAGGEVLVMADQAILGGSSNTAPNITFYRNIARYARSR